MSHARARRLLYARDLRPRGRGGEVRERLGDFRARDVVHLYSQEGDAGALVPEGEVHALLGDGDGPDLRVDDDVGRVGEASFVSSDAVDQLVTLGLPEGRLLRGGVELVVEQREGLLAGEGSAGEEGTVAHRELHFDVHAVGGSSLDEGRPEPVVHVVVGHVAHHVRPPVDAVLKLREALLDPPWCWRVGSEGIPGPLQGRFQRRVQQDHLLSSGDGSQKEYDEEDERWTKRSCKRGRPAHGGSRSRGGRGGAAAAGPVGGTSGAAPLAAAPDARQTSHHHLNNIT